MPAQGLQVSRPSGLTAAFWREPKQTRSRGKAEAKPAACGPGVALPPFSSSLMFSNSARNPLRARVVNDSDERGEREEPRRLEDVLGVSMLPAVQRQTQNCSEPMDDNK